MLYAILNNKEMRTNLTLILLVVCSFTNAQTQTCNCGKDFDFLAQSYLNDYSGIQDFQNKNPDFLKIIKKMSERANKTKDIKKCHNIIKELINYLDNGHVTFGQTEENPLFDKVAYEKSRKIMLPKLEFLTTGEALFTIPSCDLSYKSTLDSLITSNKEILERTSHFIIDVRGNEGGGDAIFEKIIPYLYTSPILLYRAQLWASLNNVKMFENLLENPNIPNEARNNIEKIIELGKKNPNTFIDMSPNKVDTLKFEAVKSMPNRVSIIIDGKCKSATEEFLLLAKQSSKVKIYGKSSSGGALDYSNLNYVFTPSGFWYASVPTTRTTRLPNFPVDPDGIKPDVLIKNSVKDIIQWIIKE
jgi:hypothetical protein